MSKLTDAYPPLFATMDAGHLFYVVDPSDATDDPAGSSKVVTGQTILDQLSPVFGSFATKAALKAKVSTNLPAGKIGYLSQSNGVYLEVVAIKDAVQVEDAGNFRADDHATTSTVYVVKATSALGRPASFNAVTGKLHIIKADGAVGNVLLVPDQTGLAIL